MRNNYYILLLISIFSLLSYNGNAQQSFWSKVDLEGAQRMPLVQRASELHSFETYKLNTSIFSSELIKAPNRFSSDSNVIIDLPVANGELQSFKVYNAPVMAKELQDKYPDIQSYVAQGLEDKTATARISVTKAGVHVSISSGNFSTIYIDPYTSDKLVYAVYHKDSASIIEPEPFECIVENTKKDVEYSMSKEVYNANDGILRTYRLALACTRQYANYHLNRQGIPTSASAIEKKETVLSEMVVAMTRVNGIFERDLSVTMELVANNDDLIFLDASSDPYSNNDAFAMLTQNQTTVNDIIGNANYDIGHVFSTGGGGVAYLGSVCETQWKAGGVTGLTAPIADPFYVDYVSHEMGHQFGANHTFNSSVGSCGGNNRNNLTAMEPGSGSTIMGYAGICSPQNVQNSSDAYFHAISILEMWLNITSNSCALETSTGNNPPVVSTGPSHTIPKSTPFILEGSATDADGDELTFNWEQMDNEISTQPPLNTNEDGPLFRSVEPTEEPIRYFPNIETVISNQLENTWEVLPSVERVMEFRLTARDNALGGGATARGDQTVIVSDAGPFVVTSQNGLTTWGVDTEETITWDVAGTDSAPVNCSHVDILFSVDGGYTYPITLASNVPNNGSATITVPNEETTTGRIMVKASDNIFFDLNDSNITVTTSMNVEDYSFNDFMLYPNPSEGVYNIEFNPEVMDDLEITLYDVNGRRIKHETYREISSNVFQMRLDYQDIKAGVYFLMIKNGDKSATKRLIKR